MAEADEPLWKAADGWQAHSARDVMLFLAGVAIDFVRSLGSQDMLLRMKSSRVLGLLLREAPDFGIPDEQLEVSAVVTALRGIKSRSVAAPPSLLWLAVY